MLLPGKSAKPRTRATQKDKPDAVTCQNAERENMNTIEAMREFLGWCSVINIGLLAFSAIFVVALRTPISSLHAKMFNLDESDLSRAYFQYLAQFKIAIIVLNIVPYLALRIMS